MIDTMEKKVVRGVSGVQQQQQLLIETLTSLYRLKLVLIPGIIVNLLF